MTYYIWFDESDKDGEFYSNFYGGILIKSKDVDKVLMMMKCKIEELGLLDEEKFSKLKEAGLKRVHNNLEASRNFFPEVCTTHTYDEKINAIKENI